jgi:hypothetical protein
MQDFLQMSGTDADYTLLHHRALFNIKQEKMDTVNTAHGRDVVMLSSSPAAAATTAATAVLVEAALESEEDSPKSNLDQRIEDEAVRFVNLSKSLKLHICGSGF